MNTHAFSAEIHCISYQQFFELPAVQCHSCAVLALQSWYARGVDVQAKLPHLATYLGHVSAVSTHHYLKLTPALRQAASERFHQRFAALLTAGGVA